MKKVYDFYRDPGHGWLKVEMKELVRLKIHLAISGYSYTKGDFVYLEEDCDLTKFCTAKKSVDNVEVKFRDHHTNRESRVRNYNGYVAYNLIPKPVTFEAKRKAALLWWRSIDSYRKREALKASPTYCGMELDERAQISSIAIHRVFCQNFGI